MAMKTPVGLCDGRVEVRLITEAQLIVELGVARETLWKWRRQGMPCVPLGARIMRYRLPDVLEWLEGVSETSRGISGAA